MRTHVARGLVGVLFPFLAVAQDSGNGLQVKPEPQCIVANGLLGVWRSDPALAERLGRKASAKKLEFREDATVLAKIPAAIATKLKAFPILLAGTMQKGETKHVFLLTVLSGNSTLVWFRERGGDPCGDAESWNVMFVRAEAKQADLLFVGGDNDNQSFEAFARDGKQVGKLAAEAALTEMVAMLRAGRVRDFAETYCAPDELNKLREKDAALEGLIARFEGERGKVIADAFDKAAKLPPVLSDDGNTATWEIGEIEELPKTLKLQRIDGRWYLR